jgi:hypothetical protein
MASTHRSNGDTTISGGLWSEVEGDTRPRLDAETREALGHNTRRIVNVVMASLDGNTRNSSIRVDQSAEMDGPRGRVVTVRDARHVGTDTLLLARSLGAEAWVEANPAQAERIVLRVCVPYALAKGMGAGGYTRRYRARPLTSVHRTTIVLGLLLAAALLAVAVWIHPGSNGGD